MEKSSSHSFPRSSQAPDPISWELQSLWPRRWKPQPTCKLRHSSKLSQRQSSTTTATMLHHLLDFTSWPSQRAKCLSLTNLKQFTPRESSTTLRLRPSTQERPCQRLSRKPRTSYSTTHRQTRQLPAWLASKKQKLRANRWFHLAGKSAP